MLYGDRKVYTVSAFNRGVARFLDRLPTLWVEGEIQELRRNAAWANVFLTLKDPKTGATLKVTIARTTFDRLELGLAEGETVHVSGRAELYELKGELGLRAGALERVGVGGHLVALERLKRELAAEGLFASERKRSLPRVPRAVGILTGADTAARGDFIATLGRRFRGDQGRRLRDPSAGARRAGEHRRRPAGAGRASGRRCRRADPGRRQLRGSSPVQRRVGRASSRLVPGSPWSRPSGTSRTPPSAISRPTRAQPRPQRPPRSSSPTSRSSEPLSRRAGSGSRSRCAGLLERDATSLRRQGERLRAAPRLLVERRRASLDHAGARLQTLSPLATLARGYAIVRAGGEAVRTAETVATGDRLEIELAAGRLGARVEDVRP